MYLGRIEWSAVYHRNTGNLTVVVFRTYILLHCCGIADGSINEMLQ